MILSNNDFSCEANPDNGARLANLQYRGINILRPYPTDGKLDDPYVYGSPMLFPANRTIGGKFHADGVEYSLLVNEEKTGSNLHGQLCAMKFETLICKKNIAKFRYVNQKEIYPFQFQIDVIYQLLQDREKSTYRITNLDSRSMPFTFGIHTTFEDPAWFKVPLKEKQQSGETGIPTGKYIPLSEDEKKYVSGIDPRSKRISGFYRAADHSAFVGNKIEYRVSENFDYWVLYNQNGQGKFLCIEPQCGSVNGLNTGECRDLKPLEIEEFTTEVIIHENC